MWTQADLLVMYGILSVIAWSCVRFVLIFLEILMISRYVSLPLETLYRKILNILTEFWLKT